MEKNNNKAKKCITLFQILLLVFLIGIIISKKLFSHDYYKISPRTEKVKNIIVENESNTNKTIGWVRVQGTNIDLPIISNDEGNYIVQVEGYAWIDNTLSISENYKAILGHNILNLSSNPLKRSNDFKRFEELLYFVDYDFAKENKYFQITLNDEEKLYKIFMVGFVQKNIELFGFTENNYLEKIKELSIYDYDVKVNKDDKIISLITCTRFLGQTLNYSFYVTGKEVSENEKVTNYSVAKNKNYEKVKKVLETQGGTENEV